MVEDGRSFDLAQDRLPLVGALVVVFRGINRLPNNVVVDLFRRLGLRWLGRGYNRGWRRFRLRQHRRN